MHDFCVGDELNRKKPVVFSPTTVSSNPWLVRAQESTGAVRVGTDYGEGRQRFDNRQRPFAYPSREPQASAYVVPRRCPFVLIFLAAISFCIGRRIVPTSVLSAAAICSPR